ALLFCGKRLDPLKGVEHLEAITEHPTEEAELGRTASSPASGLDHDLPRPRPPGGQGLADARDLTGPVGVGHVPAAPEEPPQQRELLEHPEPQEEDRPVAPREPNELQ